MSKSTFLLIVHLPAEIRIAGIGLHRDSFFKWLWGEFGSHGLLGIHEGTLLAEQASADGLETESWTVDAGIAPRERDWIASQPLTSVELYFESRVVAERAQRILRNSCHLTCEEVREQVPEDWDAQWKASFQGIDVPPFWSVRPPWSKEQTRPIGRKVIQINPGTGFGTGTHETTQICLQALAKYWGYLQGSQGLRVLDFGCGSGILSIAAVMLGGRVDAVEIDPLAVENAQENSSLSGVADRISYFNKLGSVSSSYSVIVANILRPVLFEFCAALTCRLQRPGVLILSGLVEMDVIEISKEYSLKLGMSSPTEMMSKNEWRGLIWHWNDR